VAVAALAVPAAAGPVVDVVAEAAEVTHARIDLEEDGAAAAAVAPVRAALRHVGLAAEREAPVAASSALDVDVR
jgi:hypothetical protein